MARNARKSTQSRYIAQENDAEIQSDTDEAKENTAEKSLYLYTAMIGKRTYLVITAGGTGRRLWPASRRERPKQFVDFFGTGRTLLQQTFDRFARFIPAENILISTFKDYVPLVREQLPEVPEANILAEPVQLSTAPALAWATCRVARRRSDALMFVSPSDQHIDDEVDFERQVRRALNHVAEHPVAVALGARPTAPLTSYGYIQKGESLSPSDNLYAVKSFSEKPDEGYARMFVESGEFVWNTGLFCWSVETMMRRLATLMPEAIDYMRHNLGQGLASCAEPDFIERIYPSNLYQSIDLVLLDRPADVLVQECTFGWSDVGSWTELRRMLSSDVDGNASNVPTLLRDTTDTLVRLPEGRAAVICGLKGYIVTEHDGVLLVCPSGDESLVRRLLPQVQMTLGEEYV